MATLDGADEPEGIPSGPWRGNAPPPPLPLPTLNQDAAARLRLTREGRRVLPYVAAGWTDRQTGIALGKSTDAVRRACSHLAIRLDVNSRLELVHLCHLAGVFVLPPLPEGWRDELAAIGRTNYRRTWVMPPGTAEEYLSGTSIRKLAEKNGVAFGTMRTALTRAGVTLKGRGGNTRQRQWTPPDDLREQYDSGKSIRQLSREYRVPYVPMRSALLEAGVTLRGKGDGPDRGHPTG